ncbi:PAS domain-containing protein [Actimicrobium sp. CCI2.3]|uniref:PAS domain-containing protein n=1 Tax=Actimicrobium sp. CCI2.3 TaxID=3048616 RepID=UPI002AB5DC1D|nr:PAS domain-containing protein [Actimicrobium sp. CCI2.3]MDY7576657.1 PAS domain-containing protein [Actimicrobium sp. CCI2.3]MEB0024054.1 PAS domain-containing protein [Actimicrobium sp. CCI2.3]
MLTAPIPLDEPERLRALELLDVLDSASEREFDVLVATAALVCGVPISLVSLIDHDRQWFKANVGLPSLTETPRDGAFCAHAILDDGIFEVPDTLADPRFADNPLVTTVPDIRFYAGATLRLSDGAHVGTLCVIDRVPRQLSQQQREALRLLSIAVVQALESRRMARAFLASEARFRTLSESSPLGVFATDAAGACTYTNARWQAIYGLSEADALGDGWSHTLHADDKAAVFAHWQHSVKLKQEFDMEFRVRRYDGTVRHVRSVARALLDSDDGITGYVGSVEDITERLASRRALDEEREGQTAIIQGTGAGTWEWNVQTGETRFNERWAEIVGFTLDELSTTTIQTWADLAHPDDIARSSALLQTHFAGETPYYECEARMRHRGGHWVWVYTRGKVLTHSTEGQPEWMFGIHLDITLRKVQEDRLRKSEELLNRTGALAQVGGWEVDIASGSIHWSEQTCRIHGVEPGYQPQLAEAIDFYAPEARPVIEAAVARAMAGGTDWDLELPLIQKGGCKIWVRAVGYAEFEGEKPVRLFGAFQNITQRVHDRLALEAAQQRVTLATKAGGIGMWELNVQTGVITCNALMYSLYGLPEGLGTDAYELWARHLHPADQIRAQLEFKSSLKSDADFRSEYRVIWSDGSVHFLRFAGSFMRDAAGQALRMVGVNWDVTPLRELANQLVEQHELLRVTLQSIGDAVITTDAHSQVTWLNPVAERMTGWLSGEALGRPLTQVFHIVNEETRLPTENPVATCLAQGKIVGLANHTVLISRNGDEFGIEDSAAPIRNPGGDVLGVVLVFHDVTEQRRLSGEMSYRATHDALTGLVNRAEFETRLRRTLDKAHEEHSEHALLYIDLDEFKLVNDACGHFVGDQLLQQMAKLLSEAVRVCDTLARLGGDEFAVILEHCSSDQAQRVAQQICDRMEQFRFLHGERRFRIGASIGLVPVDNRWASTAAVMQAADTSCYAAKEAGRNRVHPWFDTDQAMHARHGEMQWATRLEQALDEDRFVLYAQRIEALSEGSTGLHAEVLIRLLNSDGSLIQPGAFLPAAERFHMATRIDRWVLKRAVQQIQAMPDVTALDTLCINLSGQSVGDRAFHQHAISALTEAGNAVCRRICLEITETAAVTNMADAAIFIEQVRALGARVALDDFGAGASSFGYLKTLKIDLLKIDGSFIRDVIDDPLDAAAVRCFVDVARVMGVKTVAEFVDRPEVLAHVREIGIDYAQGFLLHRPEPIENLFGAATRLARV